jgi:hypothetical protein
MQVPFALALAAAGLIFSVCLSSAQTGTIEPDRAGPDIGVTRHPALPTFTMQQRAALYTAAMKAQLPPALPLQMQVEIGTKLPNSPQVQPLPETARVQVPAAEKYKFAVWRDQVLLVDPNNTVADILHGDVLKEYTRSQ